MRFAALTCSGVQAGPQIHIREPSKVEGKGQQNGEDEGENEDEEDAVHRLKLAAA